MTDLQKELKEIIQRVRLNIKSLQLPVDDLNLILQILIEIHCDPKGFLENNDKNYIEYFFEDFSMDIIHLLIHEKRSQNAVRFFL